jgi:hypothetical protein
MARGPRGLQQKRPEIRLQSAPFHLITIRAAHRHAAKRRTLETGPTTTSHLTGGVQILVVMRHADLAISFQLYAAAAGQSTAHRHLRRLC